jgi:alanine-glyoxylate transaminase/serine-glyoxylate transaminase/serine-pyruvate transaminase
VNDTKVRQTLLNDYNLEIGGGLGPLKGKIWRIGLMGFGSRPDNVLLALSALETTLTTEGFKISPGTGLKAAQQVLEQN